MHCIDKETCNKEICNCDKKLTECLAEFDKPNVKQICWNLLMSKEDGKDSPLKIVNSKTNALTKSLNDIKKLLKSDKKIDLNEGQKLLNETSAALKADQKASIDAMENMKKQIKRVENELEDAIVKAEKSNSNEDWENVDRISVKASRTGVEAAKLGRQIAENAEKGMEAIKEMKELENLMNKQVEAQTSATFAYPICDKIQKHGIGNDSNVRHGCFCGEYYPFHIQPNIVMAAIDAIDSCCQSRHECDIELLSFEGCKTPQGYPKECNETSFRCGKASSLCQRELCKCDMQLNRCISSLTTTTKQKCFVGEANIMPTNILSGQATKGVKDQINLAKEAIKIAGPIINKGKEAARNAIVNGGEYGGAVNNASIGSAYGPIGTAAGGFAGKLVGKYVAGAAADYLLKDGGVLDKIGNTISSFFG
uniref:Phospholipase A(2) n=1 Tax=Meloidogyne incognita TaxID=6306 RepID=A0A914MGR1_MELIC